MYRFYVPPENIKNNRVSLQGGDVKHISQVLRLQVGDKIHAMDGLGHPRSDPARCTRWRARHRKPRSYAPRWGAPRRSARWQVARTASERAAREPRDGTRPTVCRRGVEPDVLHCGRLRESAFMTAADGVAGDRPPSITRSINSLSRRIPIKITRVSTALPRSRQRVDSAVSPGSL